MASDVNGSSASSTTERMLGGGGEEAYLSLATEWGVGREAMNQKEYEEVYGDVYQTKRVPFRRHIYRIAQEAAAPCSSPRSFASCLLSFVPILTWLPRYKIRENLAGDVIGGITTGIMHVPQGLAYALLAGVDPVYGLYTSCFPALAYMLFGTSRHTSIGSFAVIALMGGIANDNVQRALLARNNTTSMLESFTSTVVSSEEPTPIQIASTITFAVGMCQFATGILHLEFLTTYFSDALVSGFTTGAAVHVLVAQIDDILGIRGVPKSKGPGYICVTLYDIGRLFFGGNRNMAAMLTSATAISFLLAGKEYLTPALKKRFGLKLPVPYELILIIISTGISYAADLSDHFDLPVVGTVPTGPPRPSLPIVNILLECLLQGIGITVVTIAVHISMAKMIAKTHDYAIDARQELYALGATGMLAAFFPVYPVSTALSRTLVNVAAGSKTLLSTVFSSALLLVIIFWLGRLLTTLPMCILASIIVTALKSMFKRCDEIRTLWRVSRTDLAIWMVAFVSTVAVNVMEGLAIAIAFALLTVVFRSQWPRWEHVLGARGNDAPRSDEEGKDLKESPAHAAVCVFRFDSPLLFTNAERFGSRARAAIDEWRGQAPDLETMQASSVKATTTISSPSRPIFILDCSSIVYCDAMGVKAVDELINDLQKVRLTAVLAAVKPDVMRIFSAHGLLAHIDKEHLFPTLRDALIIADRNFDSAMKAPPSDLTTTEQEPSTDESALPN